MKDQQKDFYIMLIEHGLELEKKNSGKFSYDQFIKNSGLDAWQVLLIEDEFENARLNHSSINHGNPRLESIFRKTKLDSKSLQQSFFMVDTGARFNYIDHQELQHARATASSANRFAILALIVAGLGAAAEIISLFIS